jgi:hypothetical protein
MPLSRASLKTEYVDGITQIKNGYLWLFVQLVALHTIESIHKYYKNPQQLYLNFHCYTELQNPLAEPSFSLHGTPKFWGHNFENTKVNYGAATNCQAADSNKSLAIRMPTLMDPTICPFTKASHWTQSQPAEFA